MPRVMAVFVVASCTAFVLWQLDPSLLFANTTAAGGDMGAHVMLPAFERQLLSRGRLAGWDPGWFDGFPFPTFYFPLPSLLVVALWAALPYDVAFKLVTVLGSVAMPAAAWALGRLGRLEHPVPECMAVGATAFLFDTSYTIDGGNLASSLAGEYDFALALALALVFLGVVMDGVRTGRHRAAAATLLAAMSLTHIVPTMYAAAGAVLVVLSGPGRRRFRWGVPVALVASALGAFWSFPFVAGLPYTTNMGWVKVTTYLHSLAPPELRWALLLAAAGAVASLVRRLPAARLLVVLTAASGIAFVVLPQGKLYNARLLPFWIVGIYLLAGVGFAESARFGARLWVSRHRLVAPPEPADLGRAADRRPGPTRPKSLRPERRRTGAVLTFGVTPVVALVCGLATIVVPLGLPSWSPVSVQATSFLPSWVQWNYSGYQAKDAWPEYHALVTTMASVGRRYGCGRAMWEYGPELNDLGTPMALMLLPYWTHGCVGSMEGLLFESSATTPYHFLNQSELSAQPSRAMVGLPYGPLDVALGVRHLQQLGVRYYMAFTPQAEAQALADRQLSLIEKSGPWATLVGSRVVQRTWDIFLVHGSATVTAVHYQPVVMTGVPRGATGWLRASLAQYLRSPPSGVVRAQSGPPSWQRVPWSAARPPLRPEPADTVSSVRIGAESVRFGVARTGVPVVVKVSYFPNWHASGALGPWRISPNLMVVVPTSHHVLLRYGWTAAGRAGSAVSVAAIAGLVALVSIDREGPLRRFARRRSARRARRGGPPAWELMPPVEDSRSTPA